STSKPVGTGPFVMDTHIAGQRWSFTKNPNYWRKGLPHLDRIDFKPVPDNAQRLQMLKSGDLAMMHTYRPLEVSELRTSELKRVEYSKGDENFLVMNTQAPPFDSLTARKAIAYATDSGGWARDIMAGVVEPATSPFAPGQLGSSGDDGYPK